MSRVFTPPGPYRAMLHAEIWSSAASAADAPNRLWGNIAYVPTVCVPSVTACGSFVSLALARPRDVRRLALLTRKPSSHGDFNTPPWLDTTLRRKGLMAGAVERLWWRSPLDSGSKGGRKRAGVTHRRVNLRRTSRQHRLHVTDEMQRCLSNRNRRIRARGHG